jgi:hypothetical protein
VRARSRCRRSPSTLFFIFVAADFGSPKALQSSDRQSGMWLWVPSRSAIVSATWCNVSYTTRVFQKSSKKRHLCTLWLTSSGRRPARYYRAWSLYSWRGPSPGRRAVVSSTVGDNGGAMGGAFAVRLKHPPETRLPLSRDQPLRLTPRTDSCICSRYVHCTSTSAKLVVKRS